MSEPVEYLVLGALEARRGGIAVELGAPLQRRLLAVLLLHPNQVVSTDELLDALWPVARPLTAPKMLQIFVSRLRRALGPESGLETRQPGYVLRATPESLDSLRFESMVRDAQRLAQSDPERAERLAERAGACWRGPLLEDVGPRDFAATAAARLDELKLAAVELRFEAALARGGGAASVPELQQLVLQHPLRERFHQQLMLSLYRAGRQADALEAFRRARELLVEELGIEPGAELQDLQRSILRQDPALAGARRELSSPAVAARPAPPAATGTARLRGGRRRRAFMVAAPASLVGIALAGLLVFNASGIGFGRGAAVVPNSVATIDPQDLSARRDQPVGADPGALTVGGGYAWVGNLGDHTVTQVALGDLHTVRTYGLSSSPVAVKYGNGAVWIVDGFGGTLSRILVSYSQLTGPFFPGPAQSGLLAIAVSPGDLWVGLPNGQVLRLDPSSLRVRSALTLHHRPLAIVAAGDALWCIEYASHDVERVDPARGAVTATLTLAGDPVGLAAAFGALWVVTAQDDRLWKVDLEGHLLGSAPLGLSPHALATGAGAVWVAGTGSGVLERFDPVRLELDRTASLGRPIGGLEASPDGLWAVLD